MKKGVEFPFTFIIFLIIIIIVVVLLLLWHFTGFDLLTKTTGNITHEFIKNTSRGAIVI